MAAVPRGLARFGGLPQHEVAGVLFGVVVAVDARAGLDPFVIEPRQLAVGRQRRNSEVDGSLRPVRVATRLERVDHVSHGLQIGGIGRAGILLHGLEPHGRRVLVERRDEPVGVLAQGDAGLLAGVDGAVVHVGEVHHLAHPVALLMPERAPEDVEAHEGAKVADVTAGIDRQPAGVHAHGAAVGRGEFLFRSGQGIEQTHDGRPARLQSVTKPVPSAWRQGS
jgi:hypothetical protein